MPNRSRSQDEPIAAIKSSLKQQSRLTFERGNLHVLTSDAINTPHNAVQPICLLDFLSLTSLLALIGCVDIINCHVLRLFYQKSHEQYVMFRLQCFIYTYNVCLPLITSSVIMITFNNNSLIFHSLLPCYLFCY